MVQIRLINKDLAVRFGAYPTVPYPWAMKQVKAGHAEFYNPSPTKPSGNGHKKPAHLLAPAVQEEPIIAVTKTKVLRKYPEIVWVQDSNFMGGAELSSQQVIKIGEKLGFDIFTLTPHNFELGILRNAKLLIINNIWTFNVTQMVEIKRAIFEFQRPYIKYEHDMRELYNDRLSFSRRLFKHSKMNVFISPLHLQEYQQKIYEMSPSHTFPLAIDVDKFKPNPKIKRGMKKVVHASGNLHNKGHQKLLAMTVQRPDMKFDIFVGQNKLITQMFAGQKNVRLRQRLDIDKMPDVYSSAGYLVHLPIGAWAGERVVLEAALCGCKLIINDNVGHKSWGWDFKDTAALRAKLKQAPYEFWREVEKVL